jgi:hypothetical protein
VTGALDPVALVEALLPVGEALDYWAWRRLADTNDKLASAIATAVAAGAPPETIRRYVVNRTGRTELAAFVEQAARWLAANQ